MGRFYAQLVDVKTWENQEEDAWTGFNVLREAGLGPADFAQLRANLYLARNTEARNLLHDRRQLKITAELGIKYDPPAKSTIAHWCSISRV